MAQSDKFLKVQKRAEEVRDKYAESQSTYFNALVLGDSGSGKTSLALTCPKPLFIDSFDPGGTKTEALKPQIDSGDILCETKWEADSWKEPFAFKDWEREMKERKDEGFFDYLGTYVLDSASRWSESLMYEIIRRGGSKGSRTGKNPQLQDYLVQQLTAVDWIGWIMALKCNVLVTAHLGFEKDEYTGAIESGPLMYGKLAKKIPIPFDECYIMRVKETSRGLEYRCQTKMDGRYAAKSRIGGRAFEMMEEPDVRAMMKKAKAAPDSYTDKDTILNPTLALEERTK
jgi:hypothetical protein